MLITAGTRPDTLAERGLEWWTCERFVIGWKGLFYWPGLAAGATSARRLAQALETMPVAEAAAELRGLFGLFVFDRHAQSWSITADHAGLYRIFHDRDTVSTSFLELLAHRQKRWGNRLDVASVLDYLAHCAVFGRATPVAGVAVLQFDEVCEIGAVDGGLKITAKSLPELPPSGAMAPSEIDAHVEAYFADLATALAPSRLSVDLTGGFDSRVVACMLARNGSRFDAGIAGHAENSDERIAREVAGRLGCDFHFVRHDIDQLEEEIPQAFVDSDGATEIARFHRDRQNALARLDRGVEAIAHGGAGELFRDHNYVQDFPLYGSTTARLGRLYDLRIRPVPLPADCLGTDARALHAAIKPRALEILERWRRPTNNETYDTIYFHVRSPEMYGPTFSSYVNLGLKVAAPMLDFENAHLAARLPPWSRFLQGWHRRMVTRHRPDLAAIRTDEGFTVSSRGRDRMSDSLLYGRTLLGRTARKITERHLGRSLFHRVGAFVADPPDFHPRLRSSAHLRLALERLQAADILAPGLDPATIRPVHVPRLMSMGLLADFLDRPERYGAGDKVSPAPSHRERRQPASGVGADVGLV